MRVHSIAKAIPTQLILLLIWYYLNVLLFEDWWCMMAIARNALLAAIIKISYYRAHGSHQIGVQCDYTQNPHTSDAASII